MADFRVDILEENQGTAPHMWIRVVDTSTNKPLLENGYGVNYSYTDLDMCINVHINERFGGFVAGRVC